MSNPLLQGTRPIRATLAAWAAALLAAAAYAQESPPPPETYLADYAKLLPGEVADRLNTKLAGFDRDTSNQVVVAIFPELPSPSLEDFTIRTAQAWRAGRKKLDNGVVLFVFVKDRKVRIEVGYGLEGALPDITAKRIIDEQIVPRFRAGDYAGGIEAAMDAIMAATRGEYRPAPAPAPAAGTIQEGQVRVLCVLFAIIAIVFIIQATRHASGRGRRRRGRLWWGGPWGGGGWSSSGGGWSSGGSSGGGFSGGGGSFGGGGASGSW
jgi:uncharacterized protein